MSEYFFRKHKTYFIRNQNFWSYMLWTLCFLGSEVEWKWLNCWSLCLWFWENQKNSKMCFSNCENLYIGFLYYSYETKFDIVHDLQWLKRSNSAGVPLWFNSFKGNCFQFDFSLDLWWFRKVRDSQRCRSDSSYRRIQLCRTHRTDFVVSDPNSSVGRCGCFDAILVTDWDYCFLQLADVPSNTLQEQNKDEVHHWLC